MILICDDDRAIRSSLSLVLTRAGYGVELAANPKEAMEFVRSVAPRLILMDMNYSARTDGEEGLTLLRQVKLFRPEVPVILITAWGSINLAVRGIQAGAFDFITKPWNNQALLRVIATALELNIAAEQSELSEESELREAFEGIVGKSVLLKNVFSTVERIAKTDAPVLITGESGTGKEMIAEAVHRLSRRKEEPFVKVNLGGVSQSLFESEMFGHKKGAFTDAHYDRVGRFELADGGSIFLDELGELDSLCQVKLLRVLQDQTFERLGDSRQRQVDVRIISATNRNLPDMVVEGGFREDLFYRVNLITIHLPALRERVGDIPLLVDHFVQQLVKSQGLEAVEVESSAMEYLKGLPYPGNIRELKNLVERTLLVSGKRRLTAEEFQKQHIELPSTHSGAGLTLGSIEEMERKMIERALKLYGAM